VRKKDHKEYFVWKSMRARCRHDKYYLKNRILVCERWNCYNNFIEDMGKRPSDKHSIDRINTLGDYEPSNCRWTTQDVQNKNRGSFNKIFTKDGRTMVLKDWARHLGINYTTLYNRIYKSNMAFEEAIFYVKNVYELRGHTYTLDELSIAYNIPKENISNRLAKKWDLERALTTPLRKR
jgi:hypothetical protein